MGSNFGAQQATKKIFYFLSAVEKTYAFVVSIEKYS